MGAHALVQIIDMLANLFTIIVFISVILTWIMPPDNPIRMALDSIVDPFLDPIRRFMPAVGMFDFSPMILMVLIEVVAQILKILVLSV